MPVYIRGELDIPAPSISSVDVDDQDTFVLDPCMVVDELPQPYRMLNKLLDQLLDDTWQKITERQQRREEEALIVHPPQIPASSTVESFSFASAMCHSSDGRYAFVAFQSGGLTAFDAVSHDRVADWTNEELNACFEFLSTAVIGQNIHVLSTIDDMGFARLFVFVDETFHLVQLLNEQPEGSAKSNARKIDLSGNGDFCGLALECDGNAWLDLYKIPRDNWLREIEVAQKDLSKRLPAASDLALSEENVAADMQTPLSNGTLEIKFSPLAVVLKVKSPTVLRGNAHASQQDAMEKIAQLGSIGQGALHLFTDEHLDLRRSLAKHAYGDKLQTYDANVELFNVPSWHYLYSARLQSEAISGSPVMENVPVAVCVWWKNSYLVQTYQLQAKPAKDLELKPDLNWPMSARITSSATTECTNIVAFGHENGFVSLIDRHLCMPRSKIFAGKNVPVIRLYILNNSSASSARSTPPISCLASLADGSVVFIDCSKDTCSVVVSAATAKGTAFVKPIASLSKVFMHCVVPGRATLRELRSGDIICELVLSKSYDEPVARIDFSCDDSMMYVKNDDDTVELFVLRELHLLDKYRLLETESPTFVLKETMEERCQRFFSQRISQQANRVEQLELSWSRMDKELSVLMGLSQIDSLVSAASSKFPKWQRATQTIIAHNQSLTRIKR